MLMKTIDDAAMSSLHVAAETADVGSAWMGALGAHWLRRKPDAYGSK
jgi:hypothetical protein